MQETNAITLQCVWVELAKPDHLHPVPESQGRRDVNTLRQKSGDMAVGQVSFHNDKKVKRGRYRRNISPSTRAIQGQRCRQPPQQDQGREGGRPRGRQAGAPARRGKKEKGGRIGTGGWSVTHPLTPATRRGRAEAKVGRGESGTLVRRHVYRRGHRRGQGGLERRRLYVIQVLLHEKLGLGVYVHVPLRHLQVQHHPSRGKAVQRLQSHGGH